MGALTEGVCSGLLKECGGLEGWLEPDYGQIAGFEESETACDGIDNDCDTLIDENDDDPLQVMLAFYCYLHERVVSIHPECSECQSLEPLLPRTLSCVS